MTKQQFINWLIKKFYEAKGEDKIEFEDGSVITQDLLGKILDALNS